MEKSPFIPIRFTKIEKNYIEGCFKVKDVRKMKFSDIEMIAEHANTMKHLGSKKSLEVVIMGKLIKYLTHIDKYTIYY